MPNDQRVYWNQTSGDAWVDLQPLLDRLYEGIGKAVVDHAFPGEGKRALDIGCGAGATTLAMARRLGPRGAAVGVDLSKPLLELARSRAAREGLASARFQEGDAQIADLGEEPFDALVSRFGVMFFSDFDAAFTHLRAAARPGAQLAFACWRSAADNAAVLAPVAAALRLLPPVPPSDPDAPGRFAFARAERVKGILERSGWHRIAIEPLDVTEPATVDEIVTMSTRLGTLGPLLPAQEPALRQAVDRAMRDLLEPLAEDGRVEVPSACWLVTARA